MPFGKNSLPVFYSTHRTVKPASIGSTAVMHVANLFPPSFSQQKKRNRTPTIALAHQPTPLRKG